MRILITGARAPVALEWAAMCIKHGHDVILTDSLAQPLGAFLRGIEHYVKTASPRFSFPTYQQQILNLLTQQRIDMVIPTCEEVYYLAHIAQQCPRVHFFYPIRHYFAHCTTSLPSLTNFEIYLKFPYPKLVWLPINMRLRLMLAQYSNRFTLDSAVK